MTGSPKPVTREYPGTDQLAYAPPYLVYVGPEPIDWAERWRRLVWRRRLVAMLVGVFTAAALVLAFLWPPVYRAEVLMVPVSESGTQLDGLTGQFGHLAALIGVNLPARQDRTQEHIAALRSRTAAMTFMHQKELIPVLFADSWNGQAREWKDPGRKPSDWEAYKLWDEDIRGVSQDKRTGLVALTIDWRDPVLAAQWANDFVRHVNDRLRQEAVRDATRSIEYLNRQLPRTSSMEVRQAIYRLIEAETKRRMIASTKEEYAFGVVDPAVPPEERARPKRLLITIVGFVLGLTVAVLTAWGLGGTGQSDGRGAAS